MAERDNEALANIVPKWEGFTGISLPFRSAFSMVKTLERAYGENFSVEKACEALDTLAELAGRMSFELREAYNKLEETNNKPTE